MAMTLLTSKTNTMTMVMAKLLLAAVDHSSDNVEKHCYIRGLRGNDDSDDAMHDNDGDVDDDNGDGDCDYTDDVVCDGSVMALPMMLIL